MSIKKTDGVTKKRIHNSTTGKYYKIRERTTKNGQKGEIMGAWKQPKSDLTKKIGREFGSVLKKLSNE